MGSEVGFRLSFRECKDSWPIKLLLPQLRLAVRRSGLSTHTRSWRLSLLWLRITSARAQLLKKHDQWSFSTG